MAWMNLLRCSFRRRSALAATDGATMPDGAMLAGEPGVGVSGGFADFLHFFRSWVTNPLRVAAIAPSGDPLARLMTQEIEPFDGPIVELGPGTGVFTRALLARGIAESELTLIEFGGEFLPGLQRRFPDARIVQMDAAELGEAGLFETRCVGAVVSGLPLLSMSPAKVEGILSGASQPFEKVVPSISSPMARVARCRARSSTGSGWKRPISAVPSVTYHRRPSTGSFGAARGEGGRETSGPCLEEVAEFVSPSDRGSAHPGCFARYSRGLRR